MATNGKFYRVFIASPGGLAEERRAFRDTVSEYNDCDAVDILVDISVLYRVLDKYNLAEKSLERAILLREAEASSSGAGLAYALYNLSSLLYEETRHADAKVPAERSLAIREARFANHPTIVAGALVRLASVETALGKYTKANELFIRALKLYGRPSSRWGVSPASIPLAILRKNQGKYSEAKRILKKAVAARERVDGPEAQSVAIALSELGDVLRRVREYQDSEVAFRRSLLIRERYLGDRHPRFASNLFGLGRLYFDQDGTSQAEQLFRRARDIFERSFGPQTIAIARCDAELGRAYIRGGRPEEAERALRPAVATLEAQLTVGHPTTIRTLRLYAEALRNVANIADAEVAERRAAEGLTIMDKTAVIEQ